MNDLLETVAEKHRARILLTLRNTPEGLTDFELSNQLGIYLSSVNAARHSLKANGLVVASDRKRPSGRGGMATVWVAA